MKRVKINSKVAMLAAMFALALMFTACSGDGDDDGDSPSSSGNGGGTSSSSSSSAGGGGGGKGNDIANYKTKQIGEQVWMAENLDYYVEGSRCYDDDEANCAIYGRLYGWTTAMVLPADCNMSSCSSQISPKHRGICPAGWHISTYEEWNELADFTNGELKAADGWENFCDRYDGAEYDECVRLFGNAGNTDAFGFAALPGGIGAYNGNFNAVGEAGYWWTASEDSLVPEYSVYTIILSEVGNISMRSSKQEALMSVRCVKD